MCISPGRFCLITVLGGAWPLYQPGTIGSIPDGQLLEIFSFCVEESYEAYDPDKYNDIKKLEVWRPHAGDGETLSLHRRVVSIYELFAQAEDG